MKTNYIFIYSNEKDVFRSHSLVPEGVALFGNQVFEI